MVSLFGSYVCNAIKYKIEITPRDPQLRNQFNLAEPLELSTENRITSYPYCLHSTSRGRNEEDDDREFEKFFISFWNFVWVFLTIKQINQFQLSGKVYM